MVGERERGMERERWWVRAMERWWVRGREGDGEGEMVGEREGGGWRGRDCG